VAQTVDGRRIAAQCREQEAVSRHQSLFALSVQVRAAYWLTMRQANELGGHVRKGEESTIVVFWKVEDRGAETQDANDTEADEESRRRFVLRYYRVWNVEQC